MCVFPYAACIGCRHADPNGTPMAPVRCEDGPEDCNTCPDKAYGPIIRSAHCAQCPPLYNRLNWALGEHDEYLNGATRQLWEAIDVRPHNAVRGMAMPAFRTRLTTRLERAWETGGGGHEGHLLLARKVDQFRELKEFVRRKADETPPEHRRKYERLVWWMLEEVLAAADGRTDDMTPAYFAELLSKAFSDLPRTCGDMPDDSYDTAKGVFAALLDGGEKNLKAKKERQKKGAPT